MRTSCDMGFLIVPFPNILLLHKNIHKQKIHYVYCEPFKAKGFILFAIIPARLLAGQSEEK